MKREFLIVVIMAFFISCKNNQKNENKIIREKTSISVEKEITKQVTLKGITFGDVYNGNSNFITTVAGVKGKLSVDKLEDGRPYRITFESSEKLSNVDFESFKLSTKKKYEISWYKQITDDLKFYWPKDGIGYWLIKHSSVSPSKLTFSIHDIAIVDSFKPKPKKIEISDDF